MYKLTNKSKKVDEVCNDMWIDKYSFQKGKVMQVFNHCTHVFSLEKATNVTFAFRVGVGCLKAALDGIAKTYATGGKVAITYDIRGLWLLAPVLLGGGISASAEIFKNVRACYPDNKIVAGCAQRTQFIDQTLIGFFEDFGFTWSMVLSITLQFKGREDVEGIFGKIVAPLISAIAGFFIRYAHYKHDHHESGHRYIELFAATVGAACSTTFIMEVLHEQEVLEEASLIPLIVFVMTGVLGFIGAYIKCYDLKILRLELTKTIEKLIEFLCENLSLTAVFFAFPTDVMAAVNDGEIPDTFLYTFCALTLCYGLSLSYLSCFNEQETDHPTPEIERRLLSRNDGFSINASEAELETDEPSSAVATFSEVTPINSPVDKRKERTVFNRVLTRTQGSEAVPSNFTSLSQVCVEEEDGIVQSVTVEDAAIEEVSDR